MRLAAAAAVLLVGCGDPRDCSIDAVEYDFAGSAVLHNCGDLYSDDMGHYDPAAYQAAQACVIDYAQQHNAFFVRWRQQYVEGFDDGAYAGVMRDGKWSLAVFQQTAGLRGIDPAERDTCADLSASSVCSTWTTNLCIQCVGRKTADACTP